MKILLGCLNVNDLGGSELYHYELARELRQAREDVTLFTLRDIKLTSKVRDKLTDLGIRQVDTRSLNVREHFDIIVSSQPGPTSYLLDYFVDTPFINIIHSEIRSEDPILYPGIVHYIGIRESIVEMLKADYKIPENKVSLIYNPIDKSRFNRDNNFSKFSDKSGRTTGLFIGEVLDNIRSKSVSRLINHCIEKDYDLLLMSESKFDLIHPNIQYIDKRWNTEEVIKKVDFTAGILVGRTTLESWCCGVPSIVFYINKWGDVHHAGSVEIEHIETLCDSKYVVAQHLNLYKEILNGSK